VRIQKTTWAKLLLALLTLVELVTLYQVCLYMDDGVSA
jgi:hypothetical protein